MSVYLRVYANANDGYASSTSISSLGIGRKRYIGDNVDGWR